MQLALHVSEVARHSTSTIRAFDGVFSAKPRIGTSRLGCGALLSWVNLGSTSGINASKKIPRRPYHSYCTLARPEVGEPARSLHPLNRPVQRTEPSRRLTLHVANGRCSGAIKNWR